MAASIITAKGRTAVPAEIRAVVHAEPGARLVWSVKPDGTIIVRAKDLENRVLDFDSAAATEAAALTASRQRTGRPVDVRDTQIAGIALVRRATLATRNVRHFQDLSVTVIDPWRPAGR